MSDVQGTPNALDRRRGLKRLAIAVGVPYFGWWAFIGLANWRTYQFAEAKWWETERKEDGVMMGIYSRMQTDAMEWVGLAVVWGAVIPVVVLIVGALAYWVYRDFKPKP